MSNPAWVKAAQNFWHSLVHDSQKTVIDDIQPAITWAATKGFTEAFAVALALVEGNPAAAWATLSADLVAQLLPMGIQLAEDEAGIFLNLAKATAVAKLKVAA